VKLLSSLLEVPAQLALALSLAASAAGDDRQGALNTAEAAAPASHVALVPQPLEGPFRFSEGSWLRALKEGLPDKDAQVYSGRIFKTSGGRYYVPAAAERGQILEARWDAALAARVARAFAERNARVLRAALRRPASAGDLYIAHVFGPEAAMSFIRLVLAKPDEAAAKHMPELAQAAPALLSAGGAPLSLAQLYKRLTDPLKEWSRGVGSTAQKGAAHSLRQASRDLKPTVADTVQRAAASRVAVSQAAAWRPEISAATQAAPPQ
jgi:hypothetical protein